jgi:hypothetical protein
LASFPADEIAQEHEAWHQARLFISQHKGQLPMLVGARLWALLSPSGQTPNRAVFWAFALSWLLVAPLVAAGCWRAWRCGDMASTILLLPLLSALLMAAVFYGSDRFRDQMAPVFLVLGAGAADALWRRATSACARAHAVASRSAVAPLGMSEPALRRAA